MCVNNMFAYIVIYGFGAAAFIMLLAGVRQFSLLFAAQKFTRTMGKITASGVEATEFGFGGLYEPNVTYSYTVRGVEYEGSRISFAVWNVFERPWQPNAIVTKYAASTTVFVYYDPVDPSFSVLEPRNATNAFFWTATGAIFFVITLIILLHPRKPGCG